MARCSSSTPRCPTSRRVTGRIIGGVTLLVLGAIEAGGSGCACPESVLMRALVADLVLHRKDALVMDMEAGIEHLGRATARGVDTLLVDGRAEPAGGGFRAPGGAAGRRDRLARHALRGQQSGFPADEQYVRAAVPGGEMAGVIPWSEEIRLAERRGQAVLDGAGKAL